MNPHAPPSGVAAHITLPPWARKTVYILTGVVAGWALFASGFELYSLARNAGFTVGISLALPIGLDAGAASAAVLWVVGPNGSPHRRQGKATTIVLVVVSAACNGISVLANPARTVVGKEAAAALSVGFVTVVAVVLAIVFPIVAARMLHMLLTVRDHGSPTLKAPVPTVPTRLVVPPTTIPPQITDDAIAPDMVALEPAGAEVDSGPPTDPVPVVTAEVVKRRPGPAPGSGSPPPNPKTDDELGQALRAYRLSSAKTPTMTEEREHLNVGWPRYKRIAREVGKGNRSRHRERAV